MAKVAIKKREYHFFRWNLSYYGRFFQSWALKNLPNLYWANVEVAAKHSVMEVFFVVFYTSPLVWVGDFMLMQGTKNPRKSPYQWINPKIVTSIYKSTSQGIMLWN